MDGNIRTIKSVAVLVVGAEGAGTGQLIHVVPKLIIDTDNHTGGVSDDFFVEDGHKLPLGKGGKLHRVKTFRIYVFFGIIVVSCPAACNYFRNVFTTPFSSRYFCFAQYRSP